MLAEQKLRSAEVLLAQQCTTGVMDLLASALLLKLAALHRQAQAPAINEAAVWLYTEIVPHGILTAEQSALVMQTISLSLNTNLPDTLIRQVAGEVGQLLAALS